MDYCAECTYLRTNDYKGSCNGLFYCEKRYDYILGNNPKCGDFCRAYRRTDYEIKDIKIKGEQEQSSNTGCYLTTMVSTILGQDDKGYVLTTLRNFRKSVLQQDSTYKQLLVEYDIIGPILAKRLENDSRREMIARNLYENILKKVLENLEKGNKEEAIKLYKGMTYGLQVCYGLAEMKVDSAIVGARDIENSGYGKVKVRKA